MSRGTERRQAESSATTRSAAVDLEEHRTHIVLHVSEPATCVSKIWGTPTSLLWSWTWWRIPLALPCSWERNAFLFWIRRLVAEGRSSMVQQSVQYAASLLADITQAMLWIGVEPPCYKR